MAPVVCGVCEGLRCVVERGEFWTLAINHIQNLLGKPMLVLNRHCERVSGLGGENGPGCICTWRRLRRR